MSTPIEVVELQIVALEAEREELYKSFITIEKQLNEKKTILAAFNIVNREAVLFDAWIQQSKITSRPENPQ